MKKGDGDSEILGGKTGNSFNILHSAFKLVEPEVVATSEKSDPVGIDPARLPM
jgi:hypothetical protein